jgi:ubiquitin carboxyl-terminal hydrolase 25
MSFINCNTLSKALKNMVKKLMPSTSECERSHLEWYTDAFRLFYGNFIWKYINTQTEDNDEAFSAINISLAGKPKDINAGLDNAFAIDTLTVNNSNTKRFRTITKLPPIFQIYLQRQDYDMTRGDSVVNRHFIELNEVIYLDRFMTLSDPALQSLRQQSWDIDAQLSKFRSKRAALESTTLPGITGPELLDTTYQFVSSHAEEISAGQALLDDLQSQTAQRRASIEALSASASACESRKAALFADHIRHAYRLAAVFVHRGSGGLRGGHYWVYIRDFASGKWRRYEDREVAEVTDLKEIFGERDPEVQGAPYFCVYVQDERKAEVVDAVWRERPVEELVEEQSERVVGDLEMDGVMEEMVEMDGKEVAAGSSSMMDVDMS